MTLKTHRSFTLMELMVAMIIVLTIALMAMTSYTKTMNQAYVDHAIRQLTLVHGAQKIYKAKHGRYYSGAMDIDTANTNLELNLVNDPKFVFGCPALPEGTWNCTMTYTSSPNFVVGVSQAPLSSTNPQCTISCP